MAVDIDQLRRDVRLTAEREGWTEQDRREVGAAIKAAIDAGDEEALAGYARDYAWWREMLAATAPRLRAFEASVRAERRRAA